MGYHVVDPDEVEPVSDRPCEMRGLTTPGELDNMAINYFRASPGEQIPLAYHYHEEQEEAFYVTGGTLHVETPDGIYEVAEGQLFTVDPGSPQRAYVPEDADAPAEVLAIGAPGVAGDTRKYEPED